jgi:hypothetical protein
MYNVLLIESPTHVRIPIHNNINPVAGGDPHLGATELMNRIASIMRLSGRLPGR